MAHRAWRGIVVALLGPLAVASGANAAPASAGNLRANPAGMAVGIVNAAYDVALDDATAAGPLAAYFDFELDEVNVRGYALGVRATRYFGGGVFREGWYASSSLIYLSMVASASKMRASGEASGITLDALLGYAWFWESGFNVLAGLGPSVTRIESVRARDPTGGSDVGEPATTGLGPSAELTIGFLLKP